MQTNTPENAAKTTRRWSSRSIGSHLQHQIFYVLIRMGGRRAAYLLLYLVVLYYVLLCPSVRRKSGHYLRRRFPGRGAFGRLLDCYRMSLELGKALVDRAVVGILGPASMDVELVGRERLLEIQAENRGIILVTAHVGCWQAAMSALGFLQTPVNMLMQREPGDIDRHYFEHQGLDCPYKIIDPQGFLGGVLEMMQVLKKGEVLCVMGDRVFGSDKNTVSAQFLGAEVAFPYSAYKLAATTGAPIVVLLSAKTGPASYRLKLAGEIRVPSRPGRGAAAFAPYVTEFVQVLEEYTREQPYQFFNFYDLWSTPDDQG